MAWRRLRAQVLREEPLCRVCLAQGLVAAATDVDHIVPKEEGGSDVRTNLQALCHSHHSQKTIREQARRGGRSVRDGRSVEGGQRRLVLPG